MTRSLRFIPALLGVLLLVLMHGDDARAVAGSAIDPGRVTAATITGTFAKQAWKITAATVADASSTLPSSTPITLIASAPSGTTLLTSNPPITAGTVDGQLLTVVNGSGKTVQITGDGSNGVVISGNSTLTFGQATFVWSADFSSWVEISSTSIDLNSTTTGILNVAQGGTGTNTLNAHHILLGQGTSQVTTVPAMGNHQLVVGTSTTTDPTNATVAGSCTLNGSATATCTATVGVSGCTPVCSYNSSTNAHTIACSVSSTTLTAVSGTANDSGVVNWICI